MEDMPQREIPPERLRKLAEWLNQPLTPGKQKELTEWLAADPENQLKWDRWLEFNTTAKQLQIVPTEALPQWAMLRDDLQFGRSSSKRRRKSRRKKRSLLKSPSVVAFVSMVLFSLFLLLLSFIRSGAKF
jgi:ferric-dicitrate binding protein FerR (iron transport regulator)